MWPRGRCPDPRPIGRKRGQGEPGDQVGGDDVDGARLEVLCADYFRLLGSRCHCWCGLCPAPQTRVVSGSKTQVVSAARVHPGIKWVTSTPMVLAQQFLDTFCLPLSK
ncbi:hypothetical protein QAD02_000651 [Eretmocerus hayati]|uniref:Uncharacterized protein n=1 Tax=Eretmocerus hayati TaxID=131215 RepID=A0ACC2NE03_9HYME|nr:hypothetical protein QAD02_000651 [Eretmocerus hayati]